MMLFLIAFAVMSLAVAGMAVGVMVSGREIKGSCGGVNNPDGGSCVCSEQGDPGACSKPAPR